MPQTIKLTKKRVVIYTRVSRDDTGEGLSVERQLESCRKLADLRDWVVIAELDETGSAWSGRKRPVWNKVLGMVESGEVDIVVAWALDRMTRSMLDLEKLILLAMDRGVGVATVSGDIDLTTETGRMVARILASVARAEVEVKAARQRLANQQRADKGLPFTGGIRAFGYEQDGMTLIPKEADAIREAAELVLAGTSINEIVRLWNSRGLQSDTAIKRGTKNGWSAHGVRNVLLNPRNAAIRTHYGEVVGGDGIWPAILSKGVHHALVRMMSDPARSRGESKGGPVPINLLTSLVTCSVCGEAVKATSLRKRMIYACSYRHSTPSRELLEEHVESALFVQLLNPALAPVMSPGEDGDLEKARTEMMEANLRLDDLGASFGAGEISRSQMRTATVTINAIKKSAEDVLAAASEGSLTEGLTGVTEAALAAQWAGLSMERKRAIVTRYLQVTIYPKSDSGPRRGRYVVAFDPESQLVIENAA